MKKPVRNYLKIVNEFINLATPFDNEILGTIMYKERGYPFISLHSHSKLAKYNVVINSGAHGEEAISVRVMLRFLQEFNSELLGYYNFIMFPIVNPYGYSYNRRKNGQNQYGNMGVSLPDDQLSPEGKLIKEALPNKVDLFIDVHADMYKTGFYIYERKRPNKSSLAGESFKVLRKQKIPIMDVDTIYQEKCIDGVIVSPIKDASMDDSMFQRGAIYSLCVEIPGKASEEQQVIGGLLLMNELLRLFKEFK